MKHEIQNIKIGDIAVNKDNARKNIEADPDFPDFVNSIKAGGVRIPVGVVIDGSKFKLCFGERRYRGAKKAGVPSIPAIVFKDISEAEAYDLMYIENKFRKDLKPLEEAAEVALLLDRFGGDVKAVSKKIGRNIQWVYVRANIVSGLIKQWHKAIEGKNGESRYASWTLSHLLQIARLPEHIQQELLKDFENKTWLDLGRLTASDLEDKIAGVLHLLSKAKWNLDDETLVPKAGACTKCPKRSGRQPMLWFDSEDQADAGDQCLDGLCWNSKYSAWLQRTAKELSEKHPGLVFISKDYPQQHEAELINQAVGSYLPNWDYKTCSKSTKGAKPAMYVQGKSAGKLTYIKVDTQRSQQDGSRPKGAPTPLKERRQALDAKRWAQVLLDLREKVKEMTIENITYPDKITAVMTLSAAYGNKRLVEPLHYCIKNAQPKVHQKEIDKLIVSTTPLSKARALELLWDSFLPTLDELLTYNGPITQTPKKYQDDAAWIAELVGVDIKLLFEDVSQRKGFTEPKSWKSLNADGTPKKAKPAKAKSQKEKAKPKKAKAEAKRQKGVCRICGCSDDNACVDEKTGEPCHWIEDDLCSNCHKNLIAAEKTA